MATGTELEYLKAFKRISKSIESISDELKEIDNGMSCLTDILEELSDTLIEIKRSSENETV